MLSSGVLESKATIDAQLATVVGCVASTVFEPFRCLVELLEGPSIEGFSKNIKHPVCSIYRRCNTSARGMFGLTDAVSVLVEDDRELKIVLCKMIRWKIEEEHNPVWRSRERRTALTETGHRVAPEPAVDDWR
jgi:hypothetical protein